MKHDFGEKLNVVSAIMCGKGVNAICRELHLDRHEVRNWVARYKAYGEGGLRKLTRCRHFTAAEKEKIVLEHIQKGVPLSHLSLHYDLDRSTIKTWLRTVRSGGSLEEVKGSERPLKDQMSRPKKKGPQTELEKLQAENLRLRAENALLKKVKALVEEQEAQAQLSGQKPSKD